MSKDWKRVRGEWEPVIEALQTAVDLHVSHALDGSDGTGRWHLNRAQVMRKEIELLKEWILWKES